jgi:hypothetical protein
MARTKKHSRAKKLGLETYAFWTGFASTIISLLQVIIIASKH